MQASVIPPALPVDLNVLDFLGPAFQQLITAPAEWRYEKGERLWSPGDSPEHLHFITEGLATTAIETADGAVHHIEYAGKGHCLCLASVIKGEPYGCFSVAAMVLKVVRVPRARFLALLDEAPPPLRALVGQMACQICRAHRRKAREQDPVARRMAKLLVSLHQQFQGRTLPFSRRELAEMSGMSTETASRTLAPWERKGLIKRSRGKAQIRRVEELMRLCADPETPG